MTSNKVQGCVLARIIGFAMFAYSELSTMQGQDADLQNREARFFMGR